MNYETTINPTDAAAAIHSRLAKIADNYPDHLNTWISWLDRDADRIAAVLDPTKPEETQYEYVAVHWIFANTPSPSLWSPMQTEIRDAVANVLQPQLETAGTTIKPSDSINTYTYNYYRTNVPNIFLRQVIVHNTYKHEIKHHWSVCKPEAFEE